MDLWHLAAGIAGYNLVKIMDGHLFSMLFDVR
jgi:hypothetical protein